MFPNDAARRTFGSRDVAVGRPDRDERYTIVKLPPDSDYLAIALDDLEEGQGQTKTLDLELIRVDRF